MLIRALPALLALAACTPPTVVQERPERAAVPIAVGCVAGERPERVVPLKERYPLPQWEALTPRQKAAHVAAQGLRHQNRADGLDAATGACR